MDFVRRCNYLTDLRWSWEPDTSHSIDMCQRISPCSHVCFDMDTD
jgi:hypothetical protein